MQASEEAETKQFERRGGWRMFKGETDTPAHVGDGLFFSAWINAYTSLVCIKPRASDIPGRTRSQYMPVRIRKKTGHFRFGHDTDHVWGQIVLGM